MPVWHAKTQRWRASGELAVIGITQEQHPERCRLFAQWKAIDWPILWDPFNTSGSKVVPNFRLIDEHGVLRVARAKPDQLPEFIARAFEAPADARKAAGAGGGGDVRVGGLPLPTDSAGRRVQNALRRLLWRRDDDPTPAVKALIAVAGSDSAPALRFRLGVALRMRHDSRFALPGDFAAAIEHWQVALRGQPDQYIWRRRIQQYGPRLDKPYPFYGWIEDARAELVAKGQAPLPLPVPLSGAERTAPNATGAKDGQAPDPQSKLPRDEQRYARVETAAAWHTEHGQSVARLHLTFRPDASRAVHWNDGAGPLRVWLEAPAGWTIERRLSTHPVAAAEVSQERRVLDVEVIAPRPGAVGAIRGYAVYGVCEDADGRCLYLRQELSVELASPQR